MTTAADHHRAWRALPVGTLDAIIGEGTCLILAPHPDDESLGCGGLIAGAVAAGRPPIVVMLTDGAASHPQSRAYPAERLRRVRAAEARAAVACLGLPEERLVFLNEADTALPGAGARFDSLAQQLVALAKRECSTILAPWRFDPHCDHEAASRLAAATGLRHLAYPVWGWMLPDAAPVAADVATGWRVDVRAHLPAKRQAIQAHRSQYGGLITDDPTGFQLPARLLSIFDDDYETYLQP